MTASLWKGLVVAVSMLSIGLSHANTADVATKHATETPSIAFINPDSPGHPFWDKVTQYMKMAADDLNMVLSIHYAQKNRYRSFAIAQTLVTSKRAPDYLVYIYQKASGKKILELAEQNGVRSFIFNTDILVDERSNVGKPREYFKHWIGHMFPNDEKAGRLLAEYLRQTAIKNKYLDDSGNVQLVALSGSRDSSASWDRNRGLEQAVNSRTDLKLNQIVFAQWQPEVAARQAQILFERYGENYVIWSASDSMALAATARLKELYPTISFVVGGIDWSDKAIDAVSNHILSATVGGHFIEGAWAMVLIHDYHHGHDFAEESLTMRSDMHLLNVSNIAAYRESPLGRKSIDFRQFSKQHNAAIQRYDFNLDRLIDSSQTATP